MFEILRETPIAAPRFRALSAVDDGTALARFALPVVAPQQKFPREIPQAFTAAPALALVRKAPW